MTPNLVVERDCAKDAQPLTFTLGMGNALSPEVIIGAVIAGIVVLSLLGKLLPKRRPKESHFKCARCGASSLHTGRTIEAWRNNKEKFFCQSCHAKWLDPALVSRTSDCW